MSLEDYTKKRAEVFQELLELSDPGDDTWSFQSEVRGVKIYKKNLPDDALPYFKGTTRIKLYGQGMFHMLTYLLSAEERPRFDRTCIAGSTLDSLLPFYSTVQFTYLNPMPRDVVLTTRYSINEDDIVLVSMESDSHPLEEQKPYISRMEFKHGGFVFRPTDDPDFVDVTYAGCLDTRSCASCIRGKIIRDNMMLLAKFKVFYKSLFGPNGTYDLEQKEVLVLDRRFNVPLGYKMERCLGKGAYGVVAKFTDANGKGLAVKKIEKVFNCKDDDYAALMEALYCVREVKLMRHLHDENIVELLDVLPLSGPDFVDVYIVMGLMETDLRRVLQYTGLKPQQVVKVAYQIVRGLKYVHSAHVVHRDMKPLNVLMNSDLSARICDFGMARVLVPEEPEAPVTGVANGEENGEAHGQAARPGAAQQPKRKLTKHNVVSQWYRPPEVILTDKYSFPIDMFSFGAILAEMNAKGFPLFKSRSTWHQLEMILRTIGPPAAEDDEYIRTSKCVVKYPEDPEAVRTAEMYKVILKKVESRQVPLHQDGHTRWDRVYPTVEESRWTEDLVELAEACIQINPAKRPTAAEALAFNFFHEWHDAHKEPDCEPMDWSFDDMELKRDALRKSMYDEAADWHPYVRQRDKIDPPPEKPWVTVKAQRAKTMRERSTLARSVTKNRTPRGINRQDSHLSAVSHLKAFEEEDGVSPMGFLTQDVGDKEITSPKYYPPGRDPYDEPY
jgi:serine/threonine protein kinase